MSIYIITFLRSFDAPGPLSAHPSHCPLRWPRPTPLASPSAPLTPPSFLSLRRPRSAPRQQLRPCLLARLRQQLLLLRTPLHRPWLTAVRPVPHLLLAQRPQQRLTQPQLLFPRPVRQLRPRP